MPSPIEQVVEQARNALLKREARRSTQLMRAYGAIWNRLQEQIAVVQHAIDDGMDRQYVLDRLQELQRQVEIELVNYGSYADAQMQEGVREAIEAALKDARRDVESSYPLFGRSLIRDSWVHLDTGLVETALGMFEHGSPLRTRMVRTLGPAVAAGIGEKVMTGLALGYGPRKVQGIIRQAFGAGLDWSMTATRTSMLYAYRSATAASYAANPELVRNWKWGAALDQRTCMSCIALHGTVHPPTEILNDHHNGRCRMIPITPTYRELGIDVDEPVGRTPQLTGEQWFRQQPEETQRAMMGDDAYDAWRSGRFDLREYTIAYTDEVYGTMLREATLGELLRRK